MVGTPEYSANVKLAELLRELCGIDCEAESSAGAKRPDIRIERTSEWIGVECKWHGDGSGEAQCAAHVRTLVKGKPIRVVAAVQYPPDLEDVPESRMKVPLRETDHIQIRTGEVSEGRIKWAESARKVSVEELGAVLNERYVAWERDTDQVDRVVSHLEAAAEAAADMLTNQGSTREAVCRALNLDRLAIDEISQSRAAVLVLANAMVLHELLTPHVDGLSPRRLGETRSETRQKWETILKVNWLPVMEPAAQALDCIPEPVAGDILDCLQPSAEHLARCGVGQQHDLAGRVFHRLLIGGKYLSPNYTTLPAAIMLAELAFDGVQINWSDLDDIRRLRVGDPACGTGTLLVASAGAIRRRHAEQAGREASALNKALVEDILWGRDVVVAVIHLAAATLCMYHPQDRIDRTNLRTMPLEVQKRDKERVARLGALDLLRNSKTGNAYEEESLPLHSSQDQKDPAKREAEALAILATELDVAILNPPFFKSAGNTAVVNGTNTWKPFYGLMTNPKDAADMRKELTKRLSRTPATMRAGGSAFALLADERLRDGGTLAIVLPANVITGSDWSEMRATWHNGYEIEWVVVSHDPRNRPKTESTPGRRHVSFSESTRIAETMIVARKRKRPPPPPRHQGSQSGSQPGHAG